MLRLLAATFTIPASLVAVHFPVGDKQRTPAQTTP